MPRVTRSQEQSKKRSDFCVLIDKTSRNAVNKPVRTTEKASEKPKKKAIKAPHVTTKSKAKVKVKPPSKSLPLQVEGEDAAPPADVGELDDPFQLVLSARPGGFATPPQSHPPPHPPKRPEPHSHDPMTTLPPRFDDGTPSPEPARRRSRHVGDRASLLPPSSPIHLSSSPVRQTHNHDGDGSSIFPSVLRPWSPSQFRTPTRKNRKRKRTPLSQPQLQSEGEINNDDLFAYGVVDDLDEREESVAWENAGSDKENHGGPREIPGSDDIADGKHPPSMPIASERGILQPRDASLSPARSGDSDPFGFFATERLLKARRAEKMVADTEAGPSNTRRGPRLPFGELAAAEVVPPAIVSESVPLPRSPSQSPPRPASPYRRYSDSEIEDLYAPASPPHTPRSRLPHAQATSPHDEATPVVVPDPLTPRNGDSARAFTMRRRRHKELHSVSEHGSEIEGSSAPSSPSPVKRVHQRPPEPESQIDYEDNQASEEEGRSPPKKARLRGKGGGKENAGRKGPAAEDPMEVARRVLDNAPRRRPARRTTATRESKASSGLVEGGDGRREARRQSTRGRGATRSTAGRATRSRGGSRTSRSRKKKVDESTPEDVSEKREQERLKRVEYFKQLDGYKLRKENVDRPILADIVQQRNDSHTEQLFATIKRKKLIIFCS
ncbi:hypothetical protein H4582DRAFT_1390694 [Lactarius indigo]|nr:hypothetical protein H4582DRAFT_1390694 [Lactarius indigo]